MGSYFNCIMCGRKVLIEEEQEIEIFCGDCQEKILCDMHGCGYVEEKEE